MCVLTSRAGFPRTVSAFASLGSDRATETAPIACLQHSALPPGRVLLGASPVQELTDEEPEPTPCGLRFAVVPAGDGSSELNTVVGVATHSEAVIDATLEMFLHISQDATGAFPIWARWHHKTSLEAFVDSWQQRKSGHVQAAINKLEAAKTKEPFNALADLQVANLYEKCEPEVLSLEPEAQGDDTPSADVLRARLGPDSAPRSSSPPTVAYSFE